MKTKVVSLIIVLLLTSCARTLNLQLSKKEISELPIVYTKFNNHKFFDTEWVFYEKNICQYSTTLMRKKTYTGTWQIVGDSVQIHFFYKGKRSPTDSSIALKELKTFQ